MSPVEPPVEPIVPKSQDSAYSSSSLGTSSPQEEVHKTSLIAQVTSIAAQCLCMVQRGMEVPVTTAFFFPSLTKIPLYNQLLSSYSCRSYMAVRAGCTVLCQLDDYLQPRTSGPAPTASQSAPDSPPAPVSSYLPLLAKITHVAQQAFFCINFYLQCIAAGTYLFPSLEKIPLYGLGLCSSWKTTFCLTELEVMLRILHFLVQQRGAKPSTPHAAAT